MANTVFPKLVPTGYNGDYTDFIVRVKSDKSGAARVVTGMISVGGASSGSSIGTSIGTNIGLAPFNKGAKLITGASQIYVPNLDSGTALNWSFGYLYSDSSSVGANAPSNTSAYSSSDSHSQLTGGGLIVLGNTTAGSSLAVVPGATAQTYDLAGDGWFVLTVNDTPTNLAAAAVSYSLLISYDQSGVQN
jgi:hypothetical protein